MNRNRSFVFAIAVTLLVVTSNVTAPQLSAQDSAASSEESGVVAYYFHGNVRCATCKKIEAYSDEAVHEGFPDALKTGELTWSVVNIDEPENSHFVQDFQLVTRSVVLAEIDDGEVVRWKNLDKVWQLVRKKEAFVDYVQTETREFLGES